MNYIIKTGPYNPKKNSLSKYEVLCLVTLYQLDPEISDRDYIIEKAKTFPFVTTPQLIVSSNLLRTKQTAQIIKESRFKNAEIESFDFLNEVKFSLESLVSQKEYEDEGSNLVRKRFIEAFIKDELKESRESIYKRIQSLLDFLEGKNNVLLISHSFFMKILQIYLQHQNLFEKPKILAQHFDHQKKTFEFCEGLEIK